MTHSSHGNETLHFRGGLVGALLPFALFLVGVAWLGLSGAPDERGFWPILVVALFASMCLARQRETWAEAVVEGMSRPVVMLMILAWLLAGILASLMGASGFVEALIWVAKSAGVTGSGYVVAAFLICCVVSTSTGTSLGTVILCAPLLYPAGGALGANPVILMGALLGGATFGDNVSPVSDTTIASAMTQDADMAGVVRSRMRYALPAAAMALVLTAALGGAPSDAPPAGDPVSDVETEVLDGDPGSPSIDPSPQGLPMLAAPALVLFLLLRRSHLLVGLLAGIAAAIVIGLGTGLLQATDLMTIDKASFGAKGLILDGIGKGIGVSIFTLLLMGLVAPIERAGVIGRLVATAENRTNSRTGAERWTFATISGAVLLTTHSTVSILVAGDFTRRMGERFGVSAYRRANLLDTTACSWPHLCPFFLPAIITASMTSSGEGFGMPRLTPFEVGFANLHSWGLLVMVLLAIGFGYGRRGEDREAGVEAS